MAFSAQSDPEPAGVYLHWPFCERKCPYCDFYSVGRDSPLFEQQSAYRETLIHEIESLPKRLGWSTEPEVDTIYLGGGTPSLMDGDDLDEIFAALGRVFRIHPASEITLEINPTSAETERIQSFLARHVNRLSIGVQSFHDRILDALGRTHTAADARHAIEQMRRLGVESLSLDLIFGAPTQTLADLRRDLKEVLAFAPEHVSIYNMTIHERTLFDRWRSEGRLTLPNEDEQIEMFELLLDRLGEAGYEHYEISNWSRPGRASRHNSKYWRRCDVYGFGVAAHSVVASRRYANPADLEQYLHADANHYMQPEPPPEGTRGRTAEIMMLGLRRVKGIEWGELNAWAGCDVRAFYRDELDRLADDALIQSDDRSIRLTHRGLLLADTVFESFF